MPTNTVYFILLFTRATLPFTPSYLFGVSRNAYTFTFRYLVEFCIDFVLSNLLGTLLFVVIMFPINVC